MQDVQNGYYFSPAQPGAPTRAFPQARPQVKKAPEAYLFTRHNPSCRATLPIWGTLRTKLGKGRVLARLGRVGEIGPFSTSWQKGV